MKVIIKTQSGVDRAEQIEDAEADKMLKAGTAQHLEGIIYREVKKPRKPRSDKGKSRKKSEYKTKVMTAEK